MSDWKEAIPCKFFIGSDKIGEVYRAEHRGPKLEVKKLEWQEFPSDAADVVIELENCIKTANNSMNSAQVDPTLRVALKPSNARFLCAALIKSLCEGGDRIAYQLQDKLDEIYKEIENGEFDE